MFSTYHRFCCITWFITRCADLELLMQGRKRFLSYFQCCIKAWERTAATASVVARRCKEQLSNFSLGFLDLVLQKTCNIFVIRRFYMLACLENIIWETNCLRIWGTMMLPSILYIARRNGILIKTKPTGGIPVHGSEAYSSYIYLLGKSWEKAESKPNSGSARAPSSAFIIFDLRSAEKELRVNNHGGFLPAADRRCRSNQKSRNLNYCRR